MGLDLVHVVSPESHVAEFTCLICCNLVDLQSTVTGCSHAFCAACLDQWLAKAKRCPTCNKDLYDGVNRALVSPLATSQPLAHRVLRRVKVLCPAGCGWTGDYGDLQSHLTSSSCALPEPDSRGAHTQSHKALADTFKEQGNSQFNSRNYQQAVDLYTKALSMFKTEDQVEESDGLYISLLANRAAAYFMMKDYNSCAADCRAVISISPGHVKAVSRLGKSLTEMGNFHEACRSVQEACDVHIPIPQALKEEATRCISIRDDYEKALRFLAGEDFARAKATLGGLLRRTNAEKVIISSARVELGLGLVDRANRLCLQINRAKVNAEALELSGCATELNGDFDRSIALFKEAARLDPDLPSIKANLRRCRTLQQVLKDARSAVFKRDFAAAVELFNVALSTAGNIPTRAPLHAMMYSESAGAKLRLKDYDGCLKDCAKCLYGKDDCVEAWSYRAKALFGLERHEEALSDMETLMRSWGQGNEVIRSCYEKAEFNVRKAKRADYYSLFNLPTVCSDPEIRKGYKARALELHPDKLSQKSAAEQKQGEELFKLLGEGLEILTDPFKRQLYDEGYDKEAIEERVQAAQRAAHRQGHGHHHR